MANISTLTVSLVADTAKFSSGLKKGRKGAVDFSKAVKTAFKAGALAIGVFTAALGTLVKQSLALVDAQRKTARTLGTTQAIFAGLSLAAGIAGISTESFTKALKRQSKSIVDATDGLQTQARAFARLNLDTKALLQLPVEKQFAAITTALGTVENATLKVAIASDIFGAKNADLINIIDIGAAGLENYIDLAKELGAALTEEQTTAIEEANDATLIFKTALTGLGNVLAAAFAPAIKAGAEAMTNFVKKVTAGVPSLIAFAAGLLGIRREISALTIIDLTEELKVLDKEINDTQGRLFLFKRSLESIRDTGGLVTPNQLQDLENLQAKLSEAEARYNALIKRRLELKKKEAEPTRITTGDDLSDTLALIDIGAIKDLRKEITPELEAFRKQLAESEALAAQIFKSTRTPIQNFVKQIADARIAVKLGFLEPEDFEKFRQGLLDTLVGTEDDFQDFTEKIGEFAKEAARNMERAFADFFFDPFDDGLKGLVRGFADTLRRMVANLLASSLLNLLAKAFGGFFGSVGAAGVSVPGAQLGTPVAGGRSVRVGEAGPEIFTPGASGAIRPLGAINFAPVTNINAGMGLDIATLIPILEENNRRVQADFVESLRRGTFA